MKLFKELQKLRDLSQKKLANTKKVLCTEYDSEEFYDLPIYYRVTKHGYYEEYAIVSVDSGEATCIAKGETDEYEITVNVIEIDTANLCLLADII